MEAATVALALALVLIGDLAQIAAFTSLTILLYYAVMNASAYRLSIRARLYPRAVAVAGFLGCLAFAAFLPFNQWLWTLALLILGAIYRVKPLSSSSRDRVA